MINERIAVLVAKVEEGYLTLDTMQSCYDCDISIDDLESGRIAFRELVQAYEETIAQLTKRQSASYSKRELKDYKPREARRVLADILEDRPPYVEGQFREIDFEARQKANLEVLGLTNRQVYLRLKKQGYIFNEERALWLKSGA